MVPYMICLFLSSFLFCIYIAEEHTRHVSMCFTVAVECVLPSLTNMRRYTQTGDSHTQHRQQGHVAHDETHWTVDLSLSLFLPSFPLSMPFPFLPLSAVTQNIFMNFHTHSLLYCLLLPCPTLPPLFLSSSVPLMYSLSLSLSSCFLFALLLLWVSVLRCYFSFFFFFFCFLGFNIFI